MSEEHNGPRPRSRFEEQARDDRSLPVELLAFLAHNKKWWLLPVIVSLAVVGALFALSTTAAAPFIYTFF